MDAKEREFWMEQEAQAHHDQRRYTGPIWSENLGRLSQAQLKKIDEVCERIRKEFDHGRWPRKPGS
mgnify:CR=1 FL=1